MLLTDTYPPDIRVEKEAKALINAGHEVTLICLYNPEQPRRETVDGVDVIRLPLQYRGGVDELIEGVNYLLTFVHNGWKNALENLLQKTNIDVIHVHDLPLVKTALTVSKDKNVDVIADFHEIWYERERHLRNSTDPITLIQNPHKIMHRLATPVWRQKILEKRCAQQADQIISVVNEAKTHFVQNCGADPDSTHVISNVVDLDFFDHANFEDIGYENEFVLSYVGTLGGKHRGIQTIIKALPAISNEIPNVRLLIVGKGDSYMKELKELAVDLNVDNLLTFTGWVDFSQVPSYIANSDICFVPHTYTTHTAKTIPHKLFQYMSLEKPTVVTSVPPLARIVNETNSGIVVPPEDPRSLAEAVVELHHQPDLAEELGKNGRAAVEEKYNWDIESEKLIRIYNKC